MRRVDGAYILELGVTHGEGVAYTYVSIFSYPELTHKAS